MLPQQRLSDKGRGRALDGSKKVISLRKFGSVNVKKTFFGRILKRIDSYISV